MEDQSTFTNIKDCILFAVPHLVINLSQSKLLPCSETEQHLANMQADGMSALSLKAQSHLTNTMLATASSLHNLMALQTETSHALV